MACAAVLRNRFLIAGGVTVIVTAKTAGIVRMPKVVRIRSPGHFQVRKDIALVNREQDLSGCLNVRAALDTDLRVFLLVEAGESRGDLLRGLCVAPVFGFN